MNVMTRHEQVLEAMEHCLKIFQSMADRGRYPEELIPDLLVPGPSQSNPLYLGKQGWYFLTEAIKREREEGRAIQEGRL